MSWRARAQDSSTMQENGTLLVLFFLVATIVLIIAILAFVRELKDAGGESTKQEQGSTDRIRTRRGHPLNGA